MDIKLAEIAAKSLHITIDQALENHKKIDDLDAYYFWQPMRGGASIIIDSNFEKLGATSSVSFERHLKAFLGGKRN